jgi:PAS domain S-box-containing protein
MVLLEETEEKILYWAAIVNSSCDAIVSQDLSGKITTWNRAAESLFGYASSEAIGRQLSDLAIFEFGPEIGLDFKRIAIEKSAFYHEALGKHRNRIGVAFPVSVMTFPIRDETGRVLGTSINVRGTSTGAAGSANQTQNHSFLEQNDQGRKAGLEAEISERKRAEERFRLVVEAAPNAMIMVAADGRITLVNSQTEKLFGYDRQELLAQPIEMLVPERFRSAHGALRNGFFNQPTARAMGSGRDLFGIRKDGAEVPIEIGLNPISSPEGNFVLTSIIDITERKRAQDEVAAAKLEVESRNKDLETMLHVTSHDLREPLRAIRNFSLMLSDRYGNQIDDKGRDLLSRVKGAAERLDRLVQDILNVTKARRILPPETVIPGRVIVADALRVLSSKIADTHAQIQVAENLPHLRVSLAWGSVAVQNLIANALKFTSENIPPEIEICGYEGRGDQEVGIIIRDRGIGVPVRHAERIFELFQRAVGREVEGTGAGLTIVKQIAERHGGRVWMQPREGGGSDFIITFGRVPGRELVEGGTH